jgi:hypothetical protein
VVTLDSQFYDVLRAVISLPDGSACTERALAAVTGSRHGETYLASMIEEGWLEGAVERGPSGNVRAVFVRAISSAGRTALAERLAHSAGQGGLATLGQVARREAGDALQVDVVELERLKGFGLITTDSGPRLTELGELLLNAARQSLATNTTIIQGVTNSQVAVGSSRIKGDISIIEQPLERSDLIAAVHDLARRVEELELGQEAEEEILADLATIRSQLDSPRPKRRIIRACAENVQAVLQSAVGSAVYAGFIEVLKRLMS